MLRLWRLYKQGLLSDEADDQAQASKDQDLGDPSDSHTCGRDSGGSDLGDPPGMVGG